MERGQMKVLTFVGFLMLISHVSVLGSEICITRDENNGVINIREARITANGRFLLSVPGGEKKCIKVKPGKYVIRAQSPDPFEPPGKNQKAWRSEPLTIFVGPRKKVTIAVEPVFRDAEFVGPWHLMEVLPQHSVGK